MSAVALAASLAAASCGGSPSSGTANTQSTPPPTAAAPSASPSAAATAAPAAAGPATVAVGDSALGKLLVDGRGRTLYLFVPDKGPTSTCYGACAVAWPPFLTTGAPVAGAGATASLIGTTNRTDGTVEVTYHGHPLYFWLGDAKPGDVSGQALDNAGGLWYVLNPAGDEVTTPAP